MPHITKVDSTLQGRRILEMDATRGTAMIAVMLSHSSQFLSSRHSVLSSWLTNLGMVATPTFLMLSGVVCGHLLSDQSRSIARVRGRLVDRGLFLLVVAHLALGVTHAMWESAGIAIARSFYITDAVGVGLLVAGLFGRGKNSKHWLFFALALLLLGWIVSFALTPVASSSFRDVYRLLVGVPEIEDLDEGWIVPIIPYLGLFSAGFAGGIALSRCTRSGISLRQVGSMCMRGGAILVFIAILCKLIVIGMRSRIPGEEYRQLFPLTDPRQKLPPGPDYVFCFGGLGIVLFGIISFLSARERWNWLVGRFAVLGRTSLFNYVLQYWIISVPALGWHLAGGVSLWFLGLLLAVASVFACSLFWDRNNGNRALTLGLRSFFERRLPD